MGALTSRQNAGVEEVDINAAHAYRYPPKSGSYFGSHFIMGGERFDTPQPEAYLFGENADLNFLGNRPTPFPYPAPQANEPTKTLKSLVNIRKESLRFVRAPDIKDVEKGNPPPPAAGDQPEKLATRYNIEFTFDSDVRCAITLHYFCSEEVTANGIIYTPRDATMNSETYQYKKGANQQFNQVSHIFDPSKYTDDELNFSMDKEIMPIVIHCVAEEGEDPKQSHVTIAVVEKNSDCTYTLKPLKQKQFVDGLCYLLQEIYGIENKNAEYCKNSTDDEIEDNGSECVICMCDIRDTLILPCRHLCLCNSCADSLRYQANNCPICRAPFRALLQIRALRKCSNPPPSSATTTTHSQDTIPQGYEAVSLIEALNGPSAAPSAPPLPARLAMPTAPLLPTAPPMVVTGSQDAMTSPTLKIPHDSVGRCLFGSNSSLRCGVTTEDSSAQTDCQMVPLGIVSDHRTSTPEVSLSMILPEALEKVVGEMAHKAESTRKLKSRTPSQEKTHLVQPQDVVRLVNEVMCTTAAEEESSHLMEAQSLLDVGPVAARMVKSDSKLISRSTPDSLHLCEKETEEQPSDGDDGPSGGESDYYTPEDPNTTILTEQVHKESQTTADLEKTEPGKPKVHPPSFIESVSLPGTPQSHASNRSSGDSFSSTSSTRLLLPNQSQETLSEDRALH